MPEPRREDWHLAELLAEQARRWRDGDRVMVEYYLARYSTLGADPASLLELIAAEFALRKELGETPSLAEYRQRFPQLGEALRDRLAGPGDETPPFVRSPQPEPARPPARLPDIPGYAILEYVDKGGQGVVYRARHLRLDRVVALKLLKEHEHHNERQLARFHREGKLAAKLDHPNIIAIYDYAEWEGRLYFSMEFAEAGSLKDRLGRDERLPPREAAELVAVLALAVQHAHDQGVVHRDLKPGNVFFTADGTPKLTDFGLAKQLTPDATELTDSRDVFGTASYMSPEQAGGSKNVSFATDIYGLGAILYTALTGQPPFAGGDWLDVLIRVRTQPVVPPSRRQPDVPAALERICLRCLEKTPEGRHATAAALAAALRRFLAGESTEPEEMTSDPAGGVPERGDVFDTLPPAGFPSAADETGSDPEPREPLSPFGRGGVRPDAIPGYEILGELGRGGLGVVYKARQLSLNRIVALKTIIGTVRDTEWQRLRLEAETVASLHHPHIVQVYDLGDHAGLVYIAMEYVEGGDLRRLLRGEPQPPRAAAELVAQVAEAVGFAHRRNIVHRDLKPANVLLIAPVDSERLGGRQAREKAASRYGFPKVTDFGLVRLPGQKEMEGTVIGTPSYMSPEQAGGRPQDIGPPADVWALGATLYEMLTGRPPFRGRTALDTLMEALQGEVVPPGKLAKVPRALEMICLKCLQKEPARRYPNGQELADDLRRFLEGRATQARPNGFWDGLFFWRKS